MATRKVKSSSDFFDLLDRLKNNTFVSIGYVTGANLEIPKVKRKNPETGRIKGYPDYTSFKTDEYQQEIGALVKITSYNFRYYNRAEIAKQYGEYKNKVDDIRGRYGLEPTQNKESYKEKTNWSDKAPELYKGDNEQLQGHSYNPQNTYGANIKGVTYIIDTEGNIIRALSDNEVKPYLKAKRETDGVLTLRKMGVEEEKIQQYIEEIQNLKFQYRNFESNSILWMCATVEGEKIIYINDSLQRAVDGININPSDFRAIARERYQISLNDLHEMVQKYNNLLKEQNMESKNNKVVRLTESKLKEMIVESFIKTLSNLNENNKKTILREMDEDTADYFYRFCNETYDYITKEIESLKSNIGNFSSSEYVEGQIDALENLYEFLKSIE